MVIGIKRILFEQISRFTHRVISPDDGGFRHEIYCNESVTIVPKTIGGQRVEYRQDNQMVDANAERVKMYGADFRFITAYLTLEMIRDLCLGNYASYDTGEFVPRNMIYLVQTMTRNNIITDATIRNGYAYFPTQWSQGSNAPLVATVANGTTPENVENLRCVNFEGLEAEDRDRAIAYLKQVITDMGGTATSTIYTGLVVGRIGDIANIGNTYLGVVYQKCTYTTGAEMLWRHGIPYTITFYGAFCNPSADVFVNYDKFVFGIVFDKTALAALRTNTATFATYCRNNPHVIYELKDGFQSSAASGTGPHVLNKYTVLYEPDENMDNVTAEFAVIVHNYDTGYTASGTGFQVDVLLPTVRVGTTDVLLTTQYDNNTEYEQDIQDYQDFINVDGNEMETFNTGFSGYDREKNLFRMTLTTDIYNGADNFGDYLMVAPCCWADNILYKLISMEFQDQPFTVHARDSFIRKLPAISIYKRGQILYYWEVIEGEDLIDVTEAGGNKMQFLY